MQDSVNRRKYQLMATGEAKAKYELMMPAGAKNSKTAEKTRKTEFVNIILNLFEKVLTFPGGYDNISKQFRTVMSKNKFRR